MVFSDDMRMAVCALPPPHGISFVPFVEPGDMNADGLVNGADIQKFVDVILGSETGPAASCAADVDVSGAADEGDIGPFVAALLTS